jgi:hypothetical protein
MKLGAHDYMLKGNLARLNDLLFGYQDYAIVGRKALVAAWAK